MAFKFQLVFFVEEEKVVHPPGASKQRFFVGGWCPDRNREIQLV